VDVFRAPARDEFLPFGGGGEGVMVGGPPTAGVAVSFYVVGKADSDRLVGVPGVPQVRSIVGADGGWGVDEVVKKVPNTNGNLAKMAEVPLPIIRIVKLGLAPGASRRRWWDARGQGQAGRSGGAPGTGGVASGGARLTYCGGRVGSHICSRSICVKSAERVGTGMGTGDDHCCCWIHRDQCSWT
jgi:hypothetical protein